MHWETEKWRKLYRKIDTSWLRLPLLARGIGSELLKYAEDDGRIAVMEDEETGEAICRLMSAHKSERKMVADLAAKLLADGYLVREPGALLIRNFSQAQCRSSNAERQARFRRRRPRHGNILERDGHACRYCGSTKQITIDHVVPRSRGGPDTEDNLVAACWPCNHRKGNRTPKQAGMVLLPIGGA